MASQYPFRYRLKLLRLKVRFHIRRLRGIWTDPRTWAQLRYGPKSRFWNWVRQGVENSQASLAYCWASKKDAHRIRLRGI